MTKNMEKKPIIFILEKSSTNYRVPKHFQNEIIPYLKKKKIKEIVDFAAGRYLVLTKILIRHFYNVSIVETKIQIKEILNNFRLFTDKGNIEILSTEKFFSNNKRYKAIILANTLHILPLEEERKTLLFKIAEKLAIGGFLYIKTAGKCIPNINSSNRKNKYNDGYYFKFKTLKNKIYATFRTGFTLEQLLSYIPECLNMEKKFIINSKEISTMFKRFK